MDVADDTTRVQPGVTPLIDRGLAEAVVTAGIRRYFAVRRALVDEFVDRHFSLRGALAIHRAALGWDLLRAPANLALGLPHALLRLAASAAGRLGAARLGWRGTSAGWLVRNCWSCRTGMARGCSRAMRSGRRFSPIRG
jgi:hypothetical protein